MQIRLERGIIWSEAEQEGRVRKLLSKSNALLTHSVMWIMHVIYRCVSASDRVCVCINPVKSSGNLGSLQWLPIVIWSIKFYMHGKYVAYATYLPVRCILKPDKWLGTVLLVYIYIWSSISTNCITASYTSYCKLLGDQLQDPVLYTG